jgi:energy-coupling factor transport system permease protein
MSGIALRFIPVFREEFTQRLNAIAMRGIVIKKLPFIKKIKLYGYLISPTVASCFVRSEELSRSMVSRGFRASKNRTMFREMKFTARDACLTALAILAAASYLYCMYRFGTLVSF